MDTKSNNVELILQSGTIQRRAAIQQSQDPLTKIHKLSGKFEECCSIRCFKYSPKTVLCFQRKPLQRSQGAVGCWLLWHIRVTLRWLHGFFRQDCDTRFSVGKSGKTDVSRLIRSMCQLMERYHHCPSVGLAEKQHKENISVLWDLQYTSRYYQ